MNLLRIVTPIAMEKFPHEEELVLRCRLQYAHVLWRCPGANLRDGLESEAIFEDVLQKSQRLFGPSHGFTSGCKQARDGLRAALAHPRSEGTIPQENPFITHPDAQVFVGDDGTAVLSDSLSKLEI